MSIKIKQPTVSEKWESALKIMESAEISKEIQTLLEAIYAPKSASSVNPPIMDEDGKKFLQVWDRWFNQYVTAEEAVFSNGKPKGYSKASLSKWNKIHAKVGSIQLDLAYSGKSRDEVEEEIIAAKSMMNNPTSFNYDDDTYRFINKIKYEVEWNGSEWETNELPEDEDEGEK